MSKDLVVRQNEVWVENSHAWQVKSFSSNGGNLKTSKQERNVVFGIILPTLGWKGRKDGGVQLGAYCSVLS